MKTLHSSFLYVLGLWVIAMGALVLEFDFFHGWRALALGFVGTGVIVFGFVKMRS